MSPEILTTKDVDVLTPDAGRRVIMERTCSIQRWSPSTAAHRGLHLRLGARHLPSLNLATS